MVKIVGTMVKRVSTIVKGVGTMGADGMVNKVAKIVTLYHFGYFIV